MKRTSIKITMMVAMAILIALLVAQAALTVTALRSVHTSSTEMATDWYPSARVLGEINLQATRYRLRAMRHVINHDPTLLREIESQLDEATAELGKAFTAYEPLVSNEVERGHWETFKADWIRYVAAQGAAIEASRRNDKVAAAERIEGARTLFLSAIDQLNGEIEANNGNVAAAAVAADTTYARALTAVVGLAGMAVIFALLAWRFIALDASRALDRQIATMHLIAKGDYAIHIPSQDRHDEIGDMARTLGAVRDSLAEAELLRLEQTELDFANLRMMAQAEQGLSDLADRLDAEVAQKTRDLVEREREIIWRLSRATERRDNETGDHIARMARISGIIAKALGLSAEDCRLIELAAQMHDIGKVGIPDDILFKPGAFTPEERLVMETHALIGWDILKGSNSPLIQMAADVAVSHHERWDGAGYPHKLAGEAIPLAGRITALADVFDALMSRRPYKRVWPIEEARAFIESNSGKHFDPTCVAAFFSRWDEIAAIAGTSADEIVASSSSTASGSVPSSAAA